MSFVPPSLQKIIDLRMISIDAEKMYIIFVLQYLIFYLQMMIHKTMQKIPFPEIKIILTQF